MRRGHGSSGRSAAQLEHLARLSDDNAFVDVEAALRRMGGESAWGGDEVGSGRGGGGAADGAVSSSALWPSTSGSGGGASPSSLAPGTTSSSSLTAGAAGGAGRLRARRGTRASEDALLSGARIPLTASLLDQHTAYLESARAAAKAWAERSDSSGSGTDEGSDTDDDDDDGGGSGSSGGAEDATATARRGARRPPAAAAEPPELVTVTAVRRGATATAVGGGKRRRTGAPVAEVAAAPEPVAGQTRQRRRRPPPPPSDTCAGLAAKLRAELRLVQQWKRTVLESSPQLINGVLSPELRAPWVQTATASRKGDTATLGKAATRADDGSGGAEVLPYPLLQMYCLCPSHEALTAAPVRRRGIVRCPVAPEDVRRDKERRTRTRSEASSTHLALITQTVRVADSSFVIRGASDSCRRHCRHHRRRPGPRASAGSVSDGGDCDGQVDYVDPGGEGAVQGDRQHHLCSVCMLPASYRCARCRTALFCSIDCHVLHDATRCLKFTV